jgi:hypothetical protein
MISKKSMKSILLRQMHGVFRGFGAGLVLILALGATVSAQNTIHITQLEVLHDKPYVMVMVNGKGPYRFAVDTGTGGEAIVTSQLAAELGLPTDGYVRLTDPSGRGGQRVPRYVIQSLEVAGVEFTGIRAALHEMSESDGSCQGLLGFVLFRDYLLTLDYPNRRMLLELGSLSPDEDASVMPFRMPDGIPIIPLRVGEVALEAQIDSGGTGLSVPEGVASRLKFASMPLLFGNEQSLSTRFQTTAGQLDADVQLGNFTFSRPFVEINPAFPLANLGSTPLQKFVLTFDQRAMLVRFQSRERVFHLAPTAAPMQLQNAEQVKPPDPGLVPVG